MTDDKRRALRRARLGLATATLALLLGTAGNADAQSSHSSLEATLDNGLRVVIVKSSLAPVVTVEMNFRVGGDETPRGFPGMAHAQEHMAFRGCTGMSADQTAAIYAELGGQNNADTQQNITQYFATVPASDLDIALRAQAACLQGIDDSPAEWAQERGAIEQEVARDLSNPTYKFIDRLNRDLFAGTPYEHDPLGTKTSFDATTGEMLRSFYRTWYAPGDAILVIVGDVNPEGALAKVRQLFGAIPNHTVPERPPVKLQPVKAETFTLDSNLPYVLGFVAYRFPGTGSPDYAAAEVLADVLNSQRADLYGMVPAGKALAAEFGVAEPYPKASVGYGVVALPAGADATGAIKEMRSILRRYAATGVPEELVEASKRHELADAELNRNSIPGLANVWSNALAAEGRRSPDEDIAAIERVSVADVNRAAKRYLGEQASITATLKPVPSGRPVATKGFGGAEQVTAAPTKPVQLPPWAAPDLGKLEVPADFIQISDTKLANGIRLIVRTDRTTPTVSVFGAVKHDFGLETGHGQDGVSDVLGELFSYGSETHDRLAFHKALDDIAANETAGYEFSLTVLAAQFSRGVELLAENEIHPALPQSAFAVVKRQTSEFLAGNLKSPEYRTLRALDSALLPPGDPILRQATPATVGSVTLDDVHRFYASTMRPDLTTIVVIGDVLGGGGEVRHREMVRPLARRRASSRYHAAAGQSQQALLGSGRGSAGGAGLGLSRGAAEPRPLRSGLLSAAARHARAGRRLLRDAALSRPAPGGGLCLYRRCAARRLQDPRELRRRVRVRSLECIEGTQSHRARSGSNAHAGCDGCGAAPGEGAHPAADRAERVQRGRGGQGAFATGRARPSPGRADRRFEKVLRPHRRPGPRGIRATRPNRGYTTVLARMCGSYSSRSSANGSAPSASQRAWHVTCSATKSP